MSSSSPTPERHRDPFAVILPVAAASVIVVVSLVVAALVGNTNERRRADADSVLEPDALLRVAGPFVEDPKRVVATGGVVAVADGP